MSDVTVRTIELDLPALAGAFGRRLHDAGVPVTAERAARFAQALTLVRPISRRRLYWTARAVLVSGRAQVPAFDAVFAAVFGTRESDAPLDAEDLRRVAAPPDDRPTAERPPREAPPADAPGLSAPSAPGGARDPDAPEREIAVPTVASSDEVLRAKRFDALERGELAELDRLMRRLAIATPRRRPRTRRA